MRNRNTADLFILTESTESMQDSKPHHVNSNCSNQATHAEVYEHLSEEHDEMDKDRRRFSILAKKDLRRILGLLIYFHNLS